VRADVGEDVAEARDGARRRLRHDQRELGCDPRQRKLRRAEPDSVRRQDRCAALTDNCCDRARAVERARVDERLPGGGGRRERERAVRSQPQRVPVEPARDERCVRAEVVAVRNRKLQRSASS
jgi:hypothetical protein